MTDHPLREQFRTALQRFLGIQEYSRFLRILNQGPADHLLAWQEERLKGFLASHPEFSCAPDEARRLLAVCDVHGQDLREEEVPIHYGTFEWPKGFLDECRRRFPYWQSSAYGPCWVEAATTTSIKYCLACRLDFKKSAWSRTVRVC